ncbi:MAG: trypsin-like peptidase domain-containing protein [Sedimentisphaerales bacterium]|nr:trypsin-like peptidase domain-containing protein [Sedimentisphaerales bacterium]
MKRCTVYGFMLGMLLAGTAAAHVIGIENFDYSDGGISGLNGGTYWDWNNLTQSHTNGTSAWGNVFGGPTVSGHELHTNNSGALRDYGSNQDNAAFRGAGCVYFSVKITLLEEQWWCGLSGYDFGTERFFFGKLSGESVFGIDSGQSDDPGYWLSSISANVNQTYHLICAIDYNGNQLRMWINPNSSDYDYGASNNSADVKGAYNGGNWNTGIRLASGGHCKWDYLIVANSFADMPIYPANDECNNATTISEGQTKTGSTTAAGGNNTCSCSTNDYKDVWYSFTPSETGPYRISTCGSSFDTTLSVYDGCGGTEVACNEDNVDLCGGYQANLVATLTSGINYKIRIAGWEQDSGNYTLTVNKEIPGNDLCTNAWEAFAWSTYTGSTMFSTGTDITSCTDGDYADVWYRFVAPYTGSYIITLEGSPYDTSLAVFSSCSGGQLACNDDVSPGVYWSELTISLTQSTSYHIRISGYGGWTGDYTMKIIPTCPVPVTPHTPSPENTQTGVPADVTLCWDGAAPPGPYGAVIYGTDDRLDEYQVTNETLLGVGGATCGLMGGLVDMGDYYQLDDSWTLGDSIQSGWGLPACSGEPYVNQPLNAYCSGTLVAPDIVMTAGHCVDNKVIFTTAFVFGYVMLDASTPLLQIPKEDVYFGRQVLAQGQDSDWALVQLDRPVVGHTPRPIRRSGKIGNTQSLTLIGHPCGLPRKYAGNARVRDNSPSVYFEANLDAYHGNSGSGVFNSSNWTTEGILVSGNEDFVQDGNCVRSNVCSDSSGCPNWEAVTRTTVFSSLMPLFDVYLGTSPGSMSLVIQDTPLYYYTPSTLTNGQTYYWKVVAKNSCSQITGPTWSFTVEPTGRIDTFESYDTGSVGSVTTIWDNVGDTNYARIEEEYNNPDNQVIVLQQKGGTTGTGYYGILPSGTTIPNGQTKTVFLQFRVGSSSTNHSIGLTDVNSPYSWSHFRPQIGFTNGVMYARDGSASRAVATLSTGPGVAWYNLWMVVNHSTKKVKLYMHQTAGAPATEANRLSSGSYNLFSYRTSTTNTLDRFFAYCGNDSNEYSAWVDNVYIMPGETLVNPRGTLPAGAFEPPVFNLEHFTFLAANWLRDDCDEENFWCDLADSNQDHHVDLIDLLELASRWLDPVD